MPDLWVPRRLTKSLQNGSGFSRQARTHYASITENDGFSAKKQAVGLGARILFVLRKADLNHQFKPRDRVTEENQNGRQPNLGEKEKSRSERIE